MGLLEFFLFCVVVLILAGACVWILGYFVPSHPGLIDRLIWGVAILLVGVTLLRALGLWQYDPQIPRLR